VSPLEELAQAVLDNRVRLEIAPGGRGGMLSSTVNLVVEPVRGPVCECGQWQHEDTPHAEKHAPLCPVRLYIEEHRS